MTPFSWRQQRSRFAPSARILALLVTEDQFLVSRRDGFILSDLRHVNLDESSPKIKSYHRFFNGNDLSFQPYSSLASIGTDLRFVFLPVEYLVLHLKRLRTHSEILSKVSSDVFVLTCFLESLLGQLFDLDGCQLFFIPVNRQLSWCCDIELDEICWSSPECELQWCYTPVTV